MQKTIGRPKTFDTNDITLVAMKYFWAHGYESSSLDDLLKVMGIKKSSFYRTFKSKEELFSASLELYVNASFKSITNMKNEIGVREALLTLVRKNIKNLECFDKEKGCLLTNAGRECFSKCEDLSEKIAIHFVAHIEFFTRMIQEAKDRKEIKNPLCSKAIASRYLSVLNGLSIMIQTGADEEVIDYVVQSAQELLE